MNLKKMQAEHWAWEQKNFPGKNSPMTAALGCAEEVGELCHSVLKQHQGIRGHEDHEANAADAIADMFMYSMSFCNHKGIDLEDLITRTWEQVQKRDWQADKETAHLQQGCSHVVFGTVDLGEGPAKALHETLQVVYEVRGLACHGDSLNPKYDRWSIKTFRSKKQADALVDQLTRAARERGDGTLWTNPHDRSRLLSTEDLRFLEYTYVRHEVC